MNSPSEKDIKRLFSLSQNRCAYPKCTTPIIQPSGTNTGEICHIRAHRPEGPRYDKNQTNEERHGFANLILLCSVHHKIVDTEIQRYTVETLQDIKSIHEREGNIELSQDDARRAVSLLQSYLSIDARDNAQVMVNSPGAIQAKVVNFRSASRKPPAIQPADVIGVNHQMLSYIEYLIKRYIEWRMDGVNRGIDRRHYHPSMTHQLIVREFGARYKLIAQDRFDDLVSFLQENIDGTIRGKNNPHRNFHTFEEHLQKLAETPKRRKKPPGAE